MPCFSLASRTSPRASAKRFVSTAHRIGLAVHVWTLDDEREMVKAVKAGADGIMTNKPTLLARVLKRERVSWPGGGDRVELITDDARSSADRR